MDGTLDFFMDRAGYRYSSPLRRIYQAEGMALQHDYFPEQSDRDGQTNEAS
jgi:hypothetical protein